MILITATIVEMEDGILDIRFDGQDVEGSTPIEGDIADALKTCMVEARDKILEAHGYKQIPVQNKYIRSFDNPEQRDEHIKEGNQ